MDSTNNYIYTIYSQSYISPLENIKEIEQELIQKNISQGKILFDLILSMGNNNERFTEAYFNGKFFEEKTFKFIQISKKDEIRRVSMEHYRLHSKLIEYSILSSVQKKMILKGLVI